MGTAGLLIVVWLLAVAPTTSLAADFVVADSGRISFFLLTTNLRDAGLAVEGAALERPGDERASLALGPAGDLRLRLREGRFDGLVGGRLPLAGGLRWSASGRHLDSADLGLEPRPGARDELRLAGPDGRTWFTLGYGHFEREGSRLRAAHFDLRLGPAFAERVGDPAMDGFLVGGATLELELRSADGGALPDGITGGCPVAEPNWPTEEGYEADIAMLKMDRVDLVARLDGRVALAPSAYFENIGNADVPWFSQFADTRNVDACCADQGGGPCAPYGNDQGGLLVYHLYRFADGRLEQIGISQVKHAFNSINDDTQAGSVECRAKNFPGRIVPSGCEDLYSASNNQDQDYLGPREEIIAHAGIWLRDGSIWDLTGPGGVPDGHCDYPPIVEQWGGQVPCHAPVSSALDRRLSVPEEDLATPGARYFMETWYLVRDDVNVFNSFGRKEISPTFTTAWHFPAAGPFRQGPVVDEFEGLQAGADHALLDTVDSGEGRLRVASTARRLAPGRWRYDIALMNIDFDRAIDRLEIPFPASVDVSGAAFFDGNGEAADDWVIERGPDWLRFEAPAGAALQWGTLVSFRFETDIAPSAGPAALRAAVAGEPGTLAIQTFTGGALLLKDSFELAAGGPS